MAADQVPGGRRAEDVDERVAIGVISSQIGQLTEAVRNGFAEMTRRLNNHADRLKTLEERAIEQDAEDRMEEKLRAALEEQEQRQRQEGRDETTITFARWQVVLAVVGTVVAFLSVAVALLAVVNHP